MTSSIFKSTQLKATLLGSFRAIGGRPDPAKLLKAILISKEQMQGGNMENKEENEKLVRVTINKLNVSNFHWKDERSIKKVKYS